MTTAADIPRCATCRHWYVDLPDDQRALCFVSMHGQTSDPLFQAASVEGPTGTQLLTRADFGCIAHEPRDTIHG